MKFPKPAFDDLLAAYDTSPESVHDCPRLYTRPVAINTCAIRMTEALAIANRLIASRAKIALLTKSGGDGGGFLLGKYHYKANLCPHGIGRGAADVAYWLQEQWGKPTFQWQKPDSAPDAIKDATGVLGFIKIPGYDGQGHMDLWNKKGAVGSAYWNSAKVFFWKLI